MYAYTNNRDQSQLTSGRAIFRVVGEEGLETYKKRPEHFPSGHFRSRWGGGVEEEEEVKEL